MAHDADSVTVQHSSLQTWSFYSRLMRHAATVPAAHDRGLGGQLFWAGELDPTGQSLVVAANVAGAATLAATSDRDAQRQAVRDGIVDFLVNSLDEALRALKNEVRKRNAIAVCVGAPLESIEREMAERGVQPDCFREAVLHAEEPSAFPSNKAVDPELDPMGVAALVAWRVDSAPAQWLPRLDALALDCLAPEELVARRWVLRASRYLGRLGHAGHLVESTRESAARFVERVRAEAARGAFAVRGTIEVTWKGASDQIFFGPATSSGSSLQG